MLRRPRRVVAEPEQTPLSAERRIGGLLVDPAGREVHVDGHPIMLTRTEFDVLELLSRRPGMVFSRNQLLGELWDQRGSEIRMWWTCMSAVCGANSETARHRGPVHPHGPRSWLPHGHRPGSTMNRRHNPPIPAARPGSGFGTRLLIAQTIVILGEQPAPPVSRCWSRRSCSTPMCSMPALIRRPRRPGTSRRPSPPRSSSRSP